MRRTATTKGARHDRHHPYRNYLSEQQIRRPWYNLRADMPEKPEPMRLPNGEVATHADLAPVFADALIDQELDDDTAYVEIPEAVREMYKVYRPSPLCRAYNLERALDTPAHIYYKFEGNNTSGSHKLNSALAQAYYAAAQGLTTITTETGAGPVGHRARRGGRALWSDLDVFMVRCSYEQKPFRPQHHGDLWRLGDALAEARPPRSAGASWRRTPRTPPARSAPPSPRPWSAPSMCPRTAAATSWAASSTRWCCTRASSAWRATRPCASSASTRTS